MSDDVWVYSTTLVRHALTLDVERDDHANAVTIVGPRSSVRYTRENRSAVLVSILLSRPLAVSLNRADGFFPRSNTRVNFVPTSRTFPVVFNV